jgi:hypothetical protein
MKKSLLAGCIALASAGTQAELSPMSEFELHNVTGQAGVDIELNVGVEIGEIRYTDTQETIGGVSDGDGGSLTISDITIGGGEGRNRLLGQPNPNNTANLDALKFSIDIGEDGDLNIIGSPVSGTGGIGIVDILLTTGEIAVEGVNGVNRHVLVDSISMYGGALSLQMLIDGPTNDIRIVTSIGIDDLDIDMSSSFGIVLEDMVIANGTYSTFVDSGLNPTPQARVANIDVTMDSDSVPEGVKFDFNSSLPGYNVFDISAPKVTVGDGMIGSLFINDLDINGISFVVSGH